MRHTSGTRFVVFVAAMSSTALLAAIQGCSSSSSSTPPAVEAGSSGSSGSSGDPPPTPDPPPAPPPAPPPTDGGTDAKKDATGDGGDGGACLDDTGAAVVCPGPGGAGCQTACDTIKNNFKKGVARDAVAALTAGICTGDTADTVTNTSAGKACVDATGATYCAALVAGGCNGAGFQAACVKVTNGLTGAATTCGAAVAGTGRFALCDCINNSAIPTCEKCLQFVEGKAAP